MADERNKKRSLVGGVLAALVVVGLFWAAGNLLDPRSGEEAAEVPIAPDNAAVLLERALESQNSAYYEESLVDFDAVLALEPDNAEAQYGRALSYLSLHDWQDAIRDYSAVLEGDPQNLDALQGRADAYAANDQPDLAISDFNAILEVDPANRIALHSRGRIFVDEGRYLEAIEAYKAAILQRPDDQFPLRELGDAYFGLGRYEEAVESYEAVLRLNAGDYLARHNVALASLNIGDYQRAVDEYDIYLAAVPDDEVAIQDRDRAATLLEESPPATEERWAELFDKYGVEGTFVLRKLGEDQLRIHNSARAEEAMIPASTFKILNSLIALETGAVDSVDEVIPWDGVDRSIDAWNRDQTLRSGIAVSAVWAYQELARRIGEEQMAEWVTAAGYGNADIGGPIDEFWLRGELRISAVEQVNVLARLLRDELPFSVEHQAAVREILVQDEGDGWTFGYKTGTALSTEPVLGWLVGYTEYNGSTWVFATNLDLGGSANLDEQIDPLVRQQLARAILAAEGALPQ